MEESFYDDCDGCSGCLLRYFHGKDRLTSIALLLTVGFTLGFHWLEIVVNLLGLANFYEDVILLSASFIASLIVIQFTKLDGAWNEQKLNFRFGKKLAAIVLLFFTSSFYLFSSCMLNMARVEVVTVTPEENGYASVPGTLALAALFYAIYLSFASDKGCKVGS